MSWNLGILLDPVLVDPHSFWRIFMILLDFVVHEHLLQIICQESHQVQALQAYSHVSLVFLLLTLNKWMIPERTLIKQGNLHFEWATYKATIFWYFFSLIVRVTAEQVVNCFKKYFLIWTKLTDPWLIYFCHAGFIVLGIVLKSFSFWICFFTSLIICWVIYLMSLGNFLLVFLMFWQGVRGLVY